jgi:XapX domain-containing protein
MQLWQGEAMANYLLSLSTGIVIGVLYAVCRVRSPAPPGIALLGLLGMVVGEHALSMFFG